MDLTKLIGMGIVAAALAALILLKLLKRKKGEEEKETETAAGIPINQAGNPEPGRPPLPVYTAEIPAARTMLLTYNTLILTDVNRPARSWKADLFRPVYVGRSQNCDICIREDSVSRRHLRVFRQGAHVYAENLNAVNGTFLNGKILKEPKEICTGSRLRLGRAELSVEID